MWLQRTKSKNETRHSPELSRPEPRGAQRSRPDAHCRGPSLWWCAGSPWQAEFGGVGTRGHHACAMDTQPSSTRVQRRASPSTGRLARIPARVQPSQSMPQRNPHPWASGPVPRRRNSKIRKGVALRDALGRSRAPRAASGTRHPKQLLSVARADTCIHTHLIRQHLHDVVCVRVLVLGVSQHLQ